MQTNVCADHDMLDRHEGMSMVYDYFSRGQDLRKPSNKKRGKEGVAPNT
jgi:hypothetical protein